MPVPDTKRVFEAFAAVLQAPFVRRRVLSRVAAVVQRYDALLSWGEPETGADPVPILFRFPSALRERSSVGRHVLVDRRARAEEEVRALKAAAPIPAPASRPDRLRMQALAEAQWLARELRALRRAARGRPLDVAGELYLETQPRDPLPEPSALVEALPGIPKGRLVSHAFDLAGLRYGVDGLAQWLVTPPMRTRSGPVAVGAVDSFVDGRGQRVEVDGRSVAVFLVDGRFRAVGAVCPHRGGPLDEGDVRDNAVFCPLHEWAFDLTTGQRRERPMLSVPVYRVEVRDAQVWVYPPNGREG